MQITIKAIGPYGVNDGQKWWKLGKGITKDQFVKDTTYEVAVFKDFINKVVGTTTEPSILNANANKATPLVNKAQPTKYGKPLSDFEIDEGTRIRRSGLIQASVQAVSSHAANKDQLVSMAIDVAEELLKWVNK